MWARHVESLPLKIDGTDLDCVRFGTGDDPLVLIPGLSFQRVKGAALPLAYMYRIFSKRYTVYVIDKKAAVPEGHTIRDLADDTARAMERLHLSSADVFGVSQGGMIAQYLATDHPHLVHKLVLSVTASRRNETMEATIGDWIDMAERGAYDALVIDMFHRMYSAAYLKRYGWAFPILSRIGRPKEFGRFIALAKACLTCEAYPELQKIACPVFVIGGRRDRVVTGEASEEIAARIGCELYLYDGLGHAAYEEAPDHNDRIYRFLES